MNPSYYGNNTQTPLPANQLIDKNKIYANLNKDPSFNFNANGSLSPYLNK